MATTKSGRQFRLAEVCKIADVQPYVLKYWETEFPALAAHRSSGQRNWSQEEVDLVLRIRELLYGEGFTIAGAKKRLEAELSQPAGPAIEPGPPAKAKGRKGEAQPERNGSASSAVAEIRADLTAILAMLKD